MAQIGEIYNKSNFTNLNDFDIVGNWFCENGVLKTSGGYSQLRFKQVSNLDRLEWKIRTNSPGLRLEFKGIGTLYNVTVILTIESGKLFWQFPTSNSSGYSSSTLTINNGDVLEYRVLKNQWTYIFFVKNINTNIEISVVLPVVFTTHNLILSASGATQILSMTKSSTQLYEPDNLVVGDSITYGANADIVNNRWVGIAQYEVSGSHGDTSSNAIPLLDEIINVIQPKRVVYAMATNDTDFDSWKINLQSFKNSLESANILFIPITPYANSNKNMQPYKDYIVANFQKYFDVFTATKASNSNAMNPAYVTDGVHPNTAGHIAIGNYIKNSPYYSINPPTPQLGYEFIIAKTLENWFILGIEPLPNPVPKYRYIRDFLTGSTANGYNNWVEIQAFSGGQNVALNKTVTCPNSIAGFPTDVITDGLFNDPNNFFSDGNVGIEVYVEIDLGALYKLDSLTIWHYYADGRTYHNVKTQVSTDGVNWKTVFDSNINGEYPETAQGHEIIIT
ncbi:galactose-binding domain-containing protein [Chryseobacterium caseinilyticum]|uniref:Discoidin domain-containing protein n=1 Tax=Chryseobacterium caseinilyticum TaxID=2771428 RepID=A0ABR8Z8B7_9FLAO|nr:discoidin domain-containing protein [Chryseobacterium caseinilyticum]MBD8081118.1 discoidin domain-containing protein [Chryseobacterium caseinilyticum]